MPTASVAGQGPAISHVTLHNGLEIVVIPDHRTPVVTHMVWYRNGSADDPVGKSGIAHFLEHLMFKGTEKHPQGEFSDVVTSLGGQENAFTSYDYTAYFQRVARDHLKTMMEFEADRMTGLVLTDDVVNPERDVVIEERRMRTDTDPSAQLGEALASTLFTHHPYGKPIIGFMHEIEGLGREDALAYYRRFYTPENAILVVAGDVTESDVLTLAEETYGKIPPRGEPPQRHRPSEPPTRAARRVTLADGKVEQPSVQLSWIVPSYRTAQPGEAEALEVLVQILSAQGTGRLHRKLVMEQKIAVAAGAWYMSTAFDQSRLSLYAIPFPGGDLDALEKATEAVIEDLTTHGVGEAELKRAKTRLIADTIYAQDSQSSLARMYGSALATGSSVSDVAAWPDAIEAVTADSVRNAAKTWLDSRRAVSGHLIKDQSAS
jgi:zinc protease